MIINFEERFENINQQMSDIKEALEKYPDYKSGGTNIVYHEPENEKQLETAKKVMRRNLGFMVIFTLAFVAFFVLTIATGKELSAILLMGGLTCIPFIFLIPQLKQKPMVMTGVAVHKMWRGKRNQKGSRVYYVSVATEIPEKLIYTSIQIPKSDYNKVMIGTPVIVVNCGGTPQARIYTE